MPKLHKTADYEEAIKMMEAAIYQEPSDPLYHALMAEIAFKLDENNRYPDPVFENNKGAFVVRWEAYEGIDASLAEINPLVITGDNKLLAVDGKMVLDDSAIFRHPDLAEMRDLQEETPAEREARLAGLSFVKLDGEIGCMVNGAGLAMTTMDIIKLSGGSPANFLDIGGGAKSE